VHRGDFGSLDLSRKVLEEMAANYVAEGKPERAVNYFHLGTSSTPGTPEQKVAAGWISDVRVTDAGLEVLISWTDRARGFILADELRYLSAEFVTASTDKRSGKSSGAKLLGAALLNDPFLTELPRVAASENTEANVDFSKQVRAWLRLAESATDAEVEATIAKLYGASVSLSESAGQVAKLAEQVKTITAERDALRAEGRVAEVKAFFAQSAGLYTKTIEKPELGRGQGARELESGWEFSVEAVAQDSTGDFSAGYLLTTVYS